MNSFVFLVTLFLSSSFTLGFEEKPLAESSVSHRVGYLSKQLRCLVCQNQSIADSQADLAVDLKNQVRELILAGKSDDEVRQFMVSRYGDFILYSPPFKIKTLVLWCGPFVVLLGMSFLVYAVVRKRNNTISMRRFSEQELAKARKDIYQ